jgi:hypothetical protein
MQPISPSMELSINASARYVEAGCHWLAPGLSDGVTNPPITGCHLGHDRSNLPTTELPNNTGQLLYVAKSRFIWSHTPKSRFFLSRVPKDIGSRRSPVQGRLRIRRTGTTGTGPRIIAKDLLPPFSAIARLPRARRDIAMPPVCTS